MFRVVIYRWTERRNIGVSGFTNSFFFSNQLMREALKFVGCQSRDNELVDRVDICRAVLAALLDPGFRTMRASDLCLSGDDRLVYNRLSHELYRIRDSYASGWHLSICSIVHQGDVSDCSRVFDPYDSVVHFPSVDD